MIVIDIWGGPNSLDHIARYVRDTSEALELARKELKNGFLVNMRYDDRIDSSGDFDARNSDEYSEEMLFTLKSLHEALRKAAGSDEDEREQAELDAAEQQAGVVWGDFMNRRQQKYNNK